MQYNVHLYVTVRVPMPGIEAATALEAIQKAEAAFDRGGPHSLIAARGEYAEEINTALVDRVGDDEYEHSKTFTFTSGEWREEGK